MSPGQPRGPSQDCGLAACQTHIQERSCSLPKSCQLLSQPQREARGNLRREPAHTSIGNIALNVRALKQQRYFGKHWVARVTKLPSTSDASSPVLQESVLRASYKSKHMCAGGNGAAPPPFSVTNGETEAAKLSRLTHSFRSWCWGKMSAASPAATSLFFGGEPFARHSKEHCGPWGRTQLLRGLVSNRHFI